MIRICEFCKKQYVWEEGQPNWSKNGIALGKGSISSQRFCCYDCGRKSIAQKRQQYFLTHYGYNNPSQVPEFNEKKKKTCLSHYGVEHPCQSDIIKERRDKTKIERYGDKNYNNSEKMHKTMQERYGVDYYSQTKEYKEKFKNTCIEHFGVDNPMKCKEVRDKGEQTNLERYGRIDVGRIGTKEHEEAMIAKYGVKWYTQTDEYKERYTNICMEKYGVSNFALSDEFKKNKAIYVEKQRKTNNERFGFDYYTQTDEYRLKASISQKEFYNSEQYYNKKEEINKKIYLTKKKNGTLGKSKIEDKIYEILLSKFPKAIHHPEPNEKYPFQCDFYIPELDLYIEYQGYKSHGIEPYNSENTEHIKIIEEYKNKAEEINYKGEKKIQYLRYIKTWTQEDPLKRKFAKENKLNWIEFFTFKEFIEWFNKH